MDALARLIAIEEIKRLKARYFFHLDHCDWTEWRTVFADDAVMDVSGQHPDAPDPSAYVYRGGDAIVRSVREALGETRTVHHGHLPIIDMTGDDEATGIWALEDSLFFPNGGRMLGYGHYHERYRRAGNTWTIAATRLTRIKVMMFDA